MTRSTLTRLALGLAVTTSGCGGARIEPEVPGPLPTPAVSEVARLQEEGSLDQERLACAAVALDATTAELAPVLPILWSASAPRYTSGGSSHARSVQDGMASSDRTNVAMRRAAGARQAAAAAAAAGDNVRAARATNWAARALRAAQQGPERGSTYVWRAPTRWAAEDSQTLLDYSAHFVEVVTT